MKKVTIRNQQVVVDGHRIPLLSGEVHYWRLSPNRWDAILERVKEMGLDVVSSYVPWEFHEVKKGQFDFTGKTDPQRDLKKFLTLISKKGLWIIIRPGPYIYSEWVNEGVPEHAALLHRSSQEFRDIALKWMKEVTKVLRPHYATHGGRVILLQPDNEMDPFSHWFEEELGLKGKPGLFQEFLEERYQNVNALNEAWETQYKSFREAQAVAENLFPMDRGNWAAHLDYKRFHHWYVTEAIRWFAETYRKLGVDIPLYLNYYPRMDVQNWREMSKVVAFSGIDTYPAREFEKGGNSYREFLEGLRYQRSFSPIPYIAEFEAGIWHGYHEKVGVLPPNHYRLTAFSALLCGIAGWNWYMLVNRDNWYFCPIQEWGRVRGELFEVFQGIVKVFKKMNPPVLQKLTETAVTIHTMHSADDRSRKEDPVLQAFYEADIDYEFFDMQSGRISKPLLFYSGSQWLDRRSQQNLLRYVEGGGNLVFFKSFPYLDEFGKTYNLFDLTKPERVLSGVGKRVRVKLRDKEAVGGGALFDYARAPGFPIIARQEIDSQQAVENSNLLAKKNQGKKFTVGYVEKRGKGFLMVLGMDPTSELLVAIHSYFKIPIQSQACLPGIQTTVLKSKKEIFLVAANNGDEDRAFEVALASSALKPGSYQFTDLWTGEKEKISIPKSGKIHLELERKSGNAWSLKKG